MRISTLPAIRGLVLLFAAAFMVPATAPAADRDTDKDPVAVLVSSPPIEKYSDPAAVNRRIEQLRQTNSSLVRVQKLAVTPGGREVLMIEIGNKGTSVPAVLVGANMSGLNPVATEAALELASRIVKDAELNSGLTWYILPVGNPDAYARYFTRPLWSDPGNARPFNDDTDDQTDEDSYNDLDGNGIITQMRVKAHDGTWIAVDGEPAWVQAAVPVAIDTGSDGRPSSVRLDFLPLIITPEE